MLSELLKLLWGSVRERAGRLFSLARKGFEWLRAQIRRLSIEKLSRVKVPSNTPGAASMRPLYERAKAVLREREKEVPSSQSTPEMPEMLDSSEMPLNEEQTASEVAASMDVPEVAREEAPAVKAAPKRTIEARARRLLTHPPKWLLKGAPLLAHSLVRKYGPPRKHERPMPRFPEITIEAPSSEHDDEFDHA